MGCRSKPAPTDEVAAASTNGAEGANTEETLSHSIASDTNSYSLTDQDDHSHESYIVEPEKPLVDKIHRFQFKTDSCASRDDNQRRDSLDRKSMWRALTKPQTTSSFDDGDSVVSWIERKKTYECSWDRLFVEGDDDRSESRGGMDDLLNLFEAGTSGDSHIMDPILEYFRPADDWVQRRPFKDSK